MDYIHKFSTGPVEMDKMLEEYHQLRKTRRYCAACPNYKKYWSCPEYAFDEALFLKEFKYMYLIAREYEIPREDKQKIFGIQPVADYCTKAMQTLKVESWKNLLELESEFPGTMGLMPGNCHVCDISGEGCTRPSKNKCRHPEFMRFSLESLGFDVDAICKYEIGILLLWPKEGHLPDKLCGVMALMSNEKIPMEAIKERFYDAKKSWLRFADSAPESRNEVRASVKRQESWIDNMRKQNLEKRNDPAYNPPQSWIGFKSDALNSGDYVKDCPWREDEEAPEAQSESAQIVEAMLEPAPEPEVKTSEAEPQTKETGSDDEDTKYQWLGFKRSVEETEEALKNRPIPKFSLSEEEKEPDVEIESAEEVKEESLATSEEVVSAPEPFEQEEPPKSEQKQEPISEQNPEPIPEPEEPEEIELPTAASVANVLSAAIEIAKDVVGSDFIKEEAPLPETPETVESEIVQDTIEEEDDSKYKWLGFKAADIKEEEAPKKGGWKKNY